MLWNKCKIITIIFYASSAFSLAAPVIYDHMISWMSPNHNQSGADVWGDHRRSLAAGTLPGSEHTLPLLTANGHVDSASTERERREVGREGRRGRREGVLKRFQGSFCFSTSGLYIKPLINPEWRPGSDRLTGQAPVQDRAWFITSELQPALIYFRRREVESRGGVFQGVRGWTQKQHC